MARSAASNQAPPRATNSRVRTFHPVLELHLPEIVMDCCGSESLDCKIVYKSVENYSGCASSESSVATSLGKLALMQGLTERQVETSPLAAGNCVQHQFLDSAGGVDP